jgi:hypothetical protein
VSRALELNINYTTLQNYFEAIFLSSNLFKNERFEAAGINTDDFPLLEYQIMARDHRGEKGEDFFALNTERYNIFPNMPGSPEAMVDRALVYAHLAPWIKEKYFVPYIKANGNTMIDLYNRRLEQMKRALGE